MDMVSVDLFQNGGKHYIVMVDKYSGFPWVSPLRSLTSSAILGKLENWFLDFGLPNVIRSDGGPQFRSEFDKYCDLKGIKKETSSAYHPKSNGLAESAVKNMKHLLKKSPQSFDAFRAALLTWRNTPKSYGYSPAQLFFGFSQNYGQGFFPPPAIH